MPPGKRTTLPHYNAKDALRVAADRVASPIRLQGRPPAAAECTFLVESYLTNFFTAISDEEPSDVEMSQASATKKTGRGRKSASRQAATPEDDGVVTTDIKDEYGDEDDEEAGDDDEDMEEEVYGCQNVLESPTRLLIPGLATSWRRSCRT